MKPWWQSKTKWGALLLGAGQVLRLFPATAPWAAVADAAGAVLGGFGLRDAVGNGTDHGEVGR